ncbi:hypothetical protein BD289DRAFT_74785 [Coniella lustricola]|uniref:Uncharacterized protein n=1 Tax=Coniella lustricola TaxID=2025994 RepID=A0A2T3AHN5_9PEZI|nr:hypothetical protein BD289DRAFT_74785 [Coniella lustricola]
MGEHGGSTFPSSMQLLFEMGCSPAVRRCTVCLHGLATRTRHGGTDCEPESAWLILDGVSLGAQHNAAGWREADRKERFEEPPTEHPRDKKANQQDELRSKTENKERQIGWDDVNGAATCLTQSGAALAPVDPALQCLHHRRFRSLLCSANSTTFGGCSLSGGRVHRLGDFLEDLLDHLDGFFFFGFFFGVKAFFM